MRQGTAPHLSHSHSFSCQTVFCLAMILAGTCEREPPIAPPLPEWEFFAEGALAITDGPHGSMTRLHLVFPSIAQPLPNSYYSISLFASAESLVVGQFMPSSALPSAELIWDEPRHLLIFGRYHRLRLNLVGDPLARLAPRSFDVWWSIPRRQDYNPCLPKPAPRWSF
jgi:hypothetical protein